MYIDVLLETDFVRGTYTLCLCYFATILLHAVTTIVSRYYAHCTTRVTLHY